MTINYTLQKVITPAIMIGTKTHHGHREISMTLQAPYRYPRDKSNPYEPWKDTNPEDEMWDKLREQARSI